MTEKNNKVSNLEELVKFLMLEPEGIAETKESEVFKEDCTFESIEDFLDLSGCDNVQFQKAVGEQQVKQVVYACCAPNA